MNVLLPEPQCVAAAPELSQPLTNPTRIQVAAGEFLISRLRLGDGPSQGVELILIDTGSTRAAICPTRGMSLWKAHIQGADLGWNSPVAGPVHPQWVPLAEPNGLGWLDGFDELLVRCGLRNFGAPEFNSQGQLVYPLHGRIANLPARKLAIEVDVEHSLLHLSGEVHETRFLQHNLQLQAVTTLAIDQPRIAIRDRVLNAGATPAEMQLLYHINLGTPHLQAGSQLHISGDKVVARDKRAAEDLPRWQSYLGPTPGYSEQVYFSASRGDASGWAKCLLAAPAGDRGVAVSYRCDTLPYFSQWKNTVAEADGYVTGLEPGTGFPNPRWFEAEHGRVVSLAGGQSIDFELAIEGIATPQRLAAVEQEIAAIRSRPVATCPFEADWCVAAP